MENPRRFIRIWLTTLAGLAALVVMVNLLVDPYDVFGTPRIAGISTFKPKADDHPMLAKTYQVARVRPATVVIGTSVADIGIDASDPVWPQAMRPVYNFGIPGSTAIGNLETLQEAVATGAIENAIVFLDFDNFLIPQPPGRTLSDDEQRLHGLLGGAPNASRPMQVAEDMFLSTATMRALNDSVTTVVQQWVPDPSDMASDGSSIKQEFVTAAQTEGMHNLFAQKDVYDAERMGTVAHVLAASNGPTANLDTVAAIIAFTRAHGVKLTLAITPRHSDELEIYWHLGLWPRVEQFKTELAALVATQGNGVRLWDFMDYSAFTTEPVPPEGDLRTATRWFWDPNHFKRALGRIMVAQILGEDAPAFGVVLTPDNVAQRNAAVRAQRQAFVCGNSAVLAAASDRPTTDGCVAVETAAKQRGPT
jgi:hypothetical protein